MSDPDIERIVQQAWSDVIHQPKAEEWSQKAAACHCARRAVELAVAKERERCAKVADEMAKSYDASWRELRAKKNRANDARECSHKATACEIIAAAIRAGKEVGSES